MEANRKTKRRTILLSALIVVCSLALIVGATFALLSGSARYPISVNSGSVSVQTTLTLNEAWRQGEAEDSRTVMDERDVTDGSIAVVDENGGPLGTVSVGDPAEGAQEGAVKAIALTDIGSGVGARFTLGITNKSSIAMKYIAYIELGEGAFAEELLIAGANGTFAEADGGRVVFTQKEDGKAGWAYALPAADPAQGEALADISFEISLPWDAQTGGSAELTLVVEAVQSNAFTGSAGFGGEEYETLADALAAAAASGGQSLTVNVGAGEHELPSDLSGLAGKDVRFVGAGENKTVLRGDYTAAGGSVTVEDAEVAGNIAANGSVFLKNVTLGGTVSVQAEDTAALAVASRAAQPAAVELQNVTVNAVSENDSTTRAIYAENAAVTIVDSSVNFTIAYDPAAADKTAFNGVVVKNGAADIRNSEITVRSASQKLTKTSSMAIGVYLDNSAACLHGRDGTYAATVIENSAVTVETNFDYAGYPRFNEQVLQLSTAEVRAVNSTLSGGTGAGLFFDSKFTAEGGSIDALWYGVTGNNLLGSAHISLTGGVTVTVKDAYKLKDNCAIYMPMQGTLTIDGATLEGYTGIQARLGTIEIDNATVRAYGEKKIIEKDGQSTPEGSALLISSHAYGFAVDVNRAPAGYTDPLEGDNSLSVTVGENAVLESKNWNPITYYDWGKTEQEVTLDSGKYEAAVVATSADTLEEYIDTRDAAFAYSELYLNADVTAGEIAVYLQSEPVTLDLCGHTIRGGVTTSSSMASAVMRISPTVNNGSPQGHTILIRNGTIESGSVTKLSYDFCIIVGSNFGTVTLEEITLKSIQTPGQGGGISVNSGNTAELKNVTIDSQNGSCGAYSAGGTINIYEGCTFKQTGDANYYSTSVAASKKGTVNVYGGTFTSEKYGMYVFNSGGAVNVYGGTFTAPVAVKADNRTEGFGSGSSELGLYGGTFNGDVELGTQVNVKIGSASGMRAFAAGVNNSSSPYAGQATLTQSIDIGGSEWTPIASGTRSGNTYSADSKRFAGTFDGGNYTIEGLTITQVPEGASGDYAFGLFGVVDGGTVRNLKLEGVNIDLPSTAECAGGAIGLLVNGGTAENIIVSGSITAGRGNAGIVGRMTVSGSIKNCTNNAAITGTAAGGNTAGIVGAAYYTAQGQTMTIENCTNNGAVTGIYGVGGIVGLSAANVSGCVNNGAVTGNGASVGGIVGEQQNYGSVENCKNFADVVNQSESIGVFGTGGIVGWIRYSGAETAYPQKALITVRGNRNEGSVTGGVSAGGIVGHVYNAALIENNVNTAEKITSANFAAGIVGSIQEGEDTIFQNAKNVRIERNVSTTAIGSIEGLCTHQFAYNNLTEGIVIENNYASEEELSGASEAA